MKRWHVVVFCCLSVVAGCATQGSVKEAQTDLVWRIDVLIQQNKVLDSLLQAQQQAVDQKWADLALEQADLKIQMIQLQARLDEVALRLGDLSRMLDARGSASSLGSPPAPVSRRAGNPVEELDAEKLYQLGIKDVEARQYALAVSAFTQFLDNFPNHRLAGNVCYWLGECHYAQDQFDRAVVFFTRVTTDYPASDKVPAAMLKLGLSHLENNNPEEGRVVLNAVVAKYPDAPEAKLARLRLDALVARQQLNGVQAAPKAGNQSQSPD